MEISSDKLLVQLPLARRNAPQEKGNRFDEQATLAQEESGHSTQDRATLSRVSRPTNNPELDYRQLLQQARQQQAGGQQQKPREAYRVGGESYRVQQALGHYRDNANWQEEGNELLPRVDDYV